MQSFGNSHLPTNFPLCVHRTSKIITMMSLLAWWRLKSPASWLFTQPFIQAQIKENIEAPRHWPLCGEFTGDQWIPRKMASNTENVSIWWRHHVNRLIDSIDMCTVTSWCVKRLWQIVRIFLLSQHLSAASFSQFAWWRHQLETFSALLALCAGNSPVPVNSPHKGQWRGALMLSLICARINDWVNNRGAGDLRRHRGHYDVNVMARWFTYSNWTVNLCVFVRLKFDMAEYLLSRHTYKHRYTGRVHTYIHGTTT